MQHSLSTGICRALVVAAFSAIVAQAANTPTYMMTRRIVADCGTPVPETRFLTTDKEALLWFYIPNMKGGSVVSDEYYSPDGQLYAPASGPWEPVEYDGDWCFDDTGSFNIAGEIPATKPGTWTVKVKVDGSVLFITTFTISPPGGANFSLSLGFVNVPAAASQRTVDVAAASSTATWTASTNDTWLAVTSGSSGKGNGTVAFSVDANLDPSPRTGTLTIADLTFTVIQDGATPATDGLPDGAICVSGQVDSITFSIARKVSHLADEVSIGGIKLCPECDLKPPVYGNFLSKLESAKVDGLSVDACYDSFGTMNFLRMRQ